MSLNKKYNNLIGQMRHKIDIQKETKTPDDLGGYQLSWQNKYSDVWAAKIPLQGSQQIRGMQIEGVVAYRFIFRYKSGITVKNRILHDGGVFNIKAPINFDTKKRFMEVLTDQGGPI